MRLSSLAAGCVLLATATPAAAQVTVSGIRNLTFGSVVRGVAVHVLPSDAVKSGEFQFVPATGSKVRLQFTLPAQLNGPAGATLPISFGASDAIATGNAANSNTVTFNPNTALSLTSVPSTAILVFIGGTVSPTANQEVGAYSNTITLTVTLQ
jgi:hypothetical protein